ncbi:MAG: DNA repair protein, partial [Rhizomicrobium sp.]
MSATAEKVAFLRASLARAEGWARTPLGHGGADACLDGGIQRGALHEVFPAAAGDAAAAAGFAVALAARVAARARVLWRRTDFAALEHGE